MSTLTKALMAVVATILVGGAAYVAAAPADRSPAALHVGDDNPGHVHRDRDRNKVEDNHVVGDDNKVEDVGDDDPGDHNTGDHEAGEVEHHANRGPGSPNPGPGNARDRGDEMAIEDNSGPGSEDSGHSGSGQSGSDDSSSDDSGSGGSGSGGSGRG
jgi:hypothetical protein